MEFEVGQLLEVQSQEIGKLCLGSYCSKSYNSSYMFGKEVVRKLQIVITLKSEGDFRDVAEREPEDPIDEIPIEPSIVGQKAMFQRVWRCLREKVGIIGLYGTGQVGKTTLLSRLTTTYAMKGIILIL